MIIVSIFIGKDINDSVDRQVKKLFFKYGFFKKSTIFVHDK